MENTLKVAAGNVDLVQPSATADDMLGDIAGRGVHIGIAVQDNGQFLPAAFA